MRLSGRNCVTGAVVGLFVSGLCGCSWLRSGSGASADAVASGARIAALSTARAGALIGKGTYRGSRKAVTWTSDRTVEGTAATLDLLGLSERPVPPDVLERLPDEMLESLTSLEFVAAEGKPEQVVISSPDSRWEGELFYRIQPEQWLEVSVTGPTELIVVSLVCFPVGHTSPSDRATYTVTVQEDEKFLGEVRFETLPNRLNCLYGSEGQGVSYPGVFVVKSLQGQHRYRFSVRREGAGGPALAAFFLPHYDSGGSLGPDSIPGQP